ncbi:MAG: hypothetical protein AB7K52_14245 [Phycisphaerales bacterium]
MNLPALITELREAGASLRAVDGRVGVYPRSALTPARRESIREHRSALLAMLRSGPWALQVPPPASAVDPEPAMCYCGHRDWWRPANDPAEPGTAPSPTAGWTCRHCHPPARPDAAAWAQGGAP